MFMFFQPVGVVLEDVYDGEDCDGMNRRKREDIGEMSETDLIVILT
jgi:hypothetical protein